MSTTLVNLLVHVVFSTRFRLELITPEIESELHRYMAGIARELESPCIAINGTSNHVHLLISLSKKITVSFAVGQLKRGSSRWVRLQGEAWRDFHWQRGYGAFSVSESVRGDVMRYIARQKEHHAERTFAWEIAALAERHRLNTDAQWLSE